VWSPAWGGQTPGLLPGVVPAKGLWKGVVGENLSVEKGFPRNETRRPAGTSLPFHVSRAPFVREFEHEATSPCRMQHSALLKRDTPLDRQHLNTSQLSIGFELACVVAVYEQLVVQRH
jgi:hypothetical protein